MNGKDEDPADRLENALNRIAFALEHHTRAPSAVVEPPADLHALAANLDVLTMRIQDLLAETSPDAAPTTAGEAGSWGK